ncbi:MAG: GGDEF domain-containing protein [Deinococcus sp.]
MMTLPEYRTIPGRLFKSSLAQGRGYAATRAPGSLAWHDGLTHALNRQALERDLELMTRAGEDGAYLLMLDLDHFRQLNERRGDLVGDRVLVELTRLVGEALRREDRVYRVGGEEFAVLLPAPGVFAARKLAERVRFHVEAHLARCVNEKPWSITVSLGLAPVVSEAQLTLAAAALLLRAAKQRGRNQVCHEVSRPTCRPSERARLEAAEPWQPDSAESPGAAD